MLLTELERFIEEDTGYNDVSNSIVPDCKAQAEIVAKDDGIVRSLAEATQYLSTSMCFRQPTLLMALRSKKMTCC